MLKKQREIKNRNKMHGVKSEAKAKGNLRVVE